MGTTESNRPEGSVRSRSPESTSQQPKQKLPIQQRVVAEPSSLPLITQTWGMPDIDLAITPANAKCQRYLSRTPFPSAEVIDCLKHPWNFRLGYIFPPTPLIARFLLRLKRSTSTVLAVIPFWPRRPWFTTLLQLSIENPLLLPITADFHFQRQISSSGTRETTSDGMEAERSRFLDQGCSQKVVEKLLQARKATTNSTYRRIWGNFISFAQQQSWNTSSPEVSQILKFLQSGQEKGLGPNTLKVQVSALSAMTELNGPKTLSSCSSKKPV